MTFEQFVEEFLKAAILQAWKKSVRGGGSNLPFFRATLAMDSYNIGYDDGHIFRPSRKN